MSPSHSLILRVPEKVICPELDFVVDYIFNYRLEVLCQIEKGRNEEHYQVFSKEKIILTVPLSGFFREKFNVDWSNPPKVVGKNEDSILFPIDGKAMFQFDVIAAIFYQIARVEELNPNLKRDEHGRFQSRDAILFNSGGYKYPLVDSWIQRIKKVLTESGVKSIKEEEFAWWNTIDVDQVYAAKSKPLVRRLAKISQLLIKGRLRQSFIFLETLFGRKDPFDMLDKMQLSKDENLIFALVGGESKFDFPKARNENELIPFYTKWKTYYKIGWHPSYDMSQSEVSFSVLEKAKVENILQQEVKDSRQHYLRFCWPDTQLKLIEVGITRDFSMGYADAIGFRAGTSRPFPFFNLNTRRKEQLEIVPFSAMDVALKNRLKYTPEKATVELGKQIGILKKCNGLFVSLWHNESLSETDTWEGWSQVFFDINNMVNEG